MRFAGYDGEIELLAGGSIRIKKGKKDAGRIIKPADVVSVTLKKPGLTMAGCIHVQVLGAKTYSSVANTTHYATDMNAICFRKQYYDEAIAFKAALERAIAGAATSSTGQAESLDIDGLRQLKQLVDEGVITQEDYEKKKAQMMGL